jgi:hypothetical protein
MLPKHREEAGPFQIGGLRRATVEALNVCVACRFSRAASAVRPVAEHFGSGAARSGDEAERPHGRPCTGRPPANTKTIYPKGWRDPRGPVRRRPARRAARREAQSARSAQRSPLLPSPLPSPSEARCVRRARDRRACDFPRQVHALLSGGAALSANRVYGDEEPLERGVSFGVGAALRPHSPQGSPAPRSPVPRSPGGRQARPLRPAPPCPRKRGRDFSPRA